MSFKHIKEGDIVTRMLAGVIEMKLKVSSVNNTELHCGPYVFDRVTGHEIDDAISVRVSHLRSDG